MTLSGKGDPRARREHAKNYRRDLDSRRPWVRWLLIGLAVVIVVGVLIYAIVSGVGI